MPKRLRPTAPIAPDAVLVGDPGRALLLAQELLEAPKMSNHARGLWGYSARTPAGDELTIQTTGIGGPSAAAVLTDLAELGVRRAIRVGTCAELEGAARTGALVVVAEALAKGGSAASFGVEPGELTLPDPRLLARLRAELGDWAFATRVASYDAAPANTTPGQHQGVAAADLQTVAVLACARRLGIAAAAVLIVTETESGETLADEALDSAAKRAARAAAAVLSS